MESKDTIEMRQKILEGALQVFKEKGARFTMDDIAEYLGMSKKTIYTVFRGKDTLLIGLVDYVFDSIKDSEAAVLRDGSLSTLERIRKIMGVLPEAYKEINFQGVYELKRKYPKIYRQVEKRLETGWETTIQLLEKGIREGVVRPLNIPLFKLMFEATLEQFFERDVLQANAIRYQDALEMVVDIMVDGIAVKE